MPIVLISVFVISCGGEEIIEEDIYQQQEQNSTKEDEGDQSSNDSDDSSQDSDSSEEDTSEDSDTTDDDSNSSDGTDDTDSEDSTDETDDSTDQTDDSDSTDQTDDSDSTDTTDGTDDTNTTDDTDNTDTTDDTNNGDGTDGSDNTSDQNDSDSSDNTDGPVCDTYGSYIFQESGGVVLAEFEDAEFSSNWELRNDMGGTSGRGYMVWTGSQYFNQPGNGLTSFKINITTPGTYRFLWKTAITEGDKSSDHNDTWLRFADAADFYGEKDGLRVYPVDSGKLPHPEGASKDGWFKVYRSGADFGFNWQARTNDNDPYDVYVVFDSPGIYTMEISARASGHGIDKFALFTDAVSRSNVVNERIDFSEITCN